MNHFPSALPPKFLCGLFIAFFSSQHVFFCHANSDEATPPPRLSRASLGRSAPLPLLLCLFPPLFRIGLVLALVHGDAVRRCYPPTRRMRFGCSLLFFWLLPGWNHVLSFLLLPSRLIARYFSPCFLPLFFGVGRSIFGEPGLGLDFCRLSPLPPARFPLLPFSSRFQRQQ